MNKSINTSILWGIIYVSVIAVIAYFLDKFFPNTILDSLGAVTLAIIIGIALGNTPWIPSSFEAGVKFSEKKILAAAIALMGLQLNITQLGELGLAIIPVIVIMMAVSISIGIFLGPKMGVRKNFGALLGIGNAVCGSSAIAALAPLVTDKKEEIGISVGVVNLLGTVGLFILPPLAIALQLDDANSGLLTGGSLQAVGHAVAAGLSVSPEAGEIATLIKMGRVLMLGPAVIILGLVFGKGQSENGKKAKVNLPGFIIVFTVLMLLNSFVDLPKEFLSTVKTIDKWLLIIAMAAIGNRILFKDLKAQGPKALLLGIIIFIFQLAFLLGYIYLI